MKPLVKYAFQGIGTQWSIETDTPLSASERRQVKNLVVAFDHAYSRFIPDSLVSKISHQAPGVFVFPSSFTELHQIYSRLESITNGAVNPLVGKSLEQLGYDADYSLRPHGETYVPPSFREAIRLDDDSVTLSQPVLIDIGAIGKGYLIDQIAGIISESHSEYVVDGSGDIAVHRSTPETIGLEDPRDTSRVIGSVSISDMSLCASALNRRAWGDGLHHLIDARTGRPASTGIIATWAVASTTVYADALTTALFFASPESLYEAFGEFFYVTMGTDGSIRHNIQSIGELYP